MIKKDLEKIISDEAGKYSYKRKGNNWTNARDQVTKIINLQKSNFGNQFYINYGYILKNVPLEGMYEHFGVRFGSLDTNEQREINKVLDFESSLPDPERVKILRDLVKKMIEKVESVRSENDLHALLQTWYPQSMIPGVTRKYFNLG